MTGQSERINIKTIAVEKLEYEEGYFDQKALIDERHWAWVKDKLNQPFEGTIDDHMVLDVAASLEVLFPDKFSQVDVPSIDFDKIEFGYFANPRTIFILFPNLNDTEADEEFQMKLLGQISQCRQDEMWPEYLKLAALEKLLNPDFAPEPLSETELAGIEDNLPGGNLLLEVFEDVRIVGSEGMDSIVNYADVALPPEKHWKRETQGFWQDLKKERLKRFGDDVFEDIGKMEEFISLIRRFSTIEANEVEVTEKGITLVYDVNLDETDTPQQPLARRF